MKRYIATIVYCLYHERFLIDAENIMNALQEAEKRRDSYYGPGAEVTCVKLKHNKEVHDVKKTTISTT